jgi:methionyl aminopeptidase
MINIKTPQDIDGLKAAGKIAAKALRLVGERVSAGVNTADLDKIAESFIRLEGATPTFLGYRGFPGSICASPNDIIVHGIPSKDLILKDGDIISVDVGASYGGWVGDNAYTFPVGDINSDKARLLEGTKASLYAGIEAATAGNRIGDIGVAVSSVAKEYGLSVVRNYTGHGVGHDMHEDPDVPNFGKPHRGIELVPGMVIAIEPMLNLGTHKNSLAKDGWAVFTADRRPSAHFEHTIAITNDKAIILTSE